MRLLAVVLCVTFGLTVIGLFTAGKKMDLQEAGGPTETVFSSESVRYRLDAGQSTFIVKAPRAGLAWFRGHSHYLAVRDFSGEAELTPDSVNPASLQLRVRADSLEETDEVFTPQQKQIINKEVREIALETDKYPEIVFKSTDVQGKLVNGQYDVKISGDLSLHGVTRRIVIPAEVTVRGDTLRARGEFKINRKDFNVRATNAFHGLVRVGHTLTFTFDIVGQRIS